MLKFSIDLKWELLFFCINHFLDLIIYLLDILVKLLVLHGLKTDQIISLFSRLFFFHLVGNTVAWVEHFAISVFFSLAINFNKFLKTSDFWFDVFGRFIQIKLQNCFFIQIIMFILNFKYLFEINYSFFEVFYSRIYRQCSGSGTPI